MSTRVPITEARARLSALLARAEAGERIIITRHGKPVACLGPVSKPEPVQFGDLAGLFIADDLTLPESVIDDFYRSRLPR